jgi:hypothetical protein
MQADEERRTAFRLAVAAGDAELDQGQSTEYGRDEREAITQEAVKAMHSGKPADPDVLP